MGVTGPVWGHDRRRETGPPKMPYICYSSSTWKSFQEVTLHHGLDKIGASIHHGAGVRFLLFVDVSRVAHHVDVRLKTREIQIRGINTRMIRPDDLVRLWQQCLARISPCCCIVYDADAAKRYSVQSGRYVYVESEIAANSAE